MKGMFLLPPLNKVECKYYRKNEENIKCGNIKALVGRSILYITSLLPIPVHKCLNCIKLYFIVPTGLQDKNYEVEQKYSSLYQVVYQCWLFP